MFLLVLLTLILSASCLLPDGFKVHTTLDVKCQSARYPNSVYCFWTQFPVPMPTLTTEYIATYRLGYNDSAETKECIQRTPTSPRCILDDIVPLSKEPHVLNVTAINPWGVTTILFPFVPENVIKPDPPIIFKVRPVSEDQIQVYWFAPRSWPSSYVHPLKYNIRYGCCESQFFWQVGPTENTTSLIRVVHPNGKYCIQVNAQYHLGYGEPSKWSHTSVFSFTEGNYSCPSLEHP